MIQGITAARSNPVRIGSNSGGARWEGKDPEKQVLIGTNAVDYDYLKTMKMELVSGRDFSQDFPSDIARDTTGNFLVNEEVVKIMGAGSLIIMYIMSREFLSLVLISIAIAIPLGWFIVGNLLRQFAYRIEMSLMVFAGIAIGAIIIAMLTVSFQSYKATGINPAEALKIE